MVVDDEYYVRLGIRETIDWGSYGVELVCEAEDGRKGFELALRFLPDIIITDIKMPGIDGLEFVEKCREAGIQSQFIVLSAHEEFSYAKTALKYGASDYLIKPIHNDQMIEAVIKAGKKAIQQNETRSYYKKLESGISMVKEKALIEILLNSRMSPAEINEKLEIFKLKLLENANYVVLIRIQDYHLALEKLAPNGLKSIRETLFAIAGKHLNPNNDCHTYIINKDEEEIVAIVHTDLDDEQAVSKISESCQSILKEMQKVCRDLTITAGISMRCDSLDQLSSGYKQAYIASFRNSLQSQYKISYYRDSEIPGHRREIVDALNFIRLNYSKDITVESIASELFISASHLMHLFKSELGKTINECVTEYRIEAAKQMLKNPKYKMLEISQKVGYKNEKYFTRVFKKVTGMNPSDYARMNR